MSNRTLYLLGGATSFNLLSRAAAVSVSSENSDYPRPYLYDGRAIAPFKFGSVLATHYIEADLLQTINGDFELGSGGTFTGWSNYSTGASTVAQTTTLQCYGARAVDLLANGSDYAWLEQPYVVRPGEWFYCEASLRGGASGATAILFIIDRSRGTFWNGAAWTTVQSAAMSESGTAGPLTNGYTKHSTTFQMPPWSSYQSGQVHLSVICFSNSTAGHANFDGVSLLPGVSFASIHGHGLIPSSGMRMLLESTSAAGFGAPTTRAEFAIAQPSFYAALPNVIFDRYWRFDILGGQGWDSTNKPGIGEAVLGQYDVFERGPDHATRIAHQTDVSRAQVRLHTGAGDAYVFNRSSFPQRAIRLPYSGSDVFMRNLVLELDQRSENGLYPLVIVPSELLPDVILGRVEPAFGVQKKLTKRAAGTAPPSEWYSRELLIRELAFPQFAQ